MENVHVFDQRAQIISELLQGLESAKQLQNQITNKSTISLCNEDDHEPFKYLSLIEKMMSTFDKTITIAQQINPINPNNHVDHLELPQNFSVSNPISQKSSLELPPSKRRKMMPRWTKTVQISPDKVFNGLEGPLDDGYSWRKYGQKGILGAKFPRGYYRCTHRYSKGCVASKQVQRSDVDLSIYQVMYRGEHTCYPGPNLESAQPKKRQISAHQPKYQRKKAQSSQSPPQHYPISPAQEVFVGLGPKGEVEIEPSSPDKAQIFRCFSFNSPSVEVEFLEFGSPTTSESNYFPDSPCVITGPGVGLNVQTSESDINDSNSGQNSVTNSPTMDDFEFSLGALGQWLDLEDLNLF
ncbi:putative WRKY transcription factor 41 [Silene latifolia]|uniref:putative WRKY transcription factor 41 n=1 Tax=Silene latifolia TaxID=37657 RepID=UPI003D7746EC